MSVRVRFAPSPTGQLHIGNVRTALYSWLWARQTGGAFVLRIEDTDEKRSTPEAVATGYESLRWLGLDWDEGPEAGGEHGPYLQSERKALYREHAEKLIAEGAAFRCYATREEIQALRADYEVRHGKGFRFRSPWRERTDGDPNAPHTVRFRAPSEGDTGWEDLVYGAVSYPNAEQQDFPLLRPNGLPLYNFGCFVDDLTMGITLVSRGDDHLVNTPQQLLLYRAWRAIAAGTEPPRFAHLPIVLGPDGKRFSKRHGAAAVLEYREKGYLPEAVLNYLARLGWSHGDEEIFTRDELVAKFAWENVGRSPSKYDLKKFEHVQATHLREKKSDAELAVLVAPHLAARGVEVAAEDPRLVAAIAPVKLRATTLPELAEGLDYFFRPDADLTYEAKGRRKFLTEESAPRLAHLAGLVEAAEPFDEPTLESAITAWMEREELAMKHVAQPARVALTGRTRSPGLYETLVLLGQARSVARLRRGATLASEAAEVSG